MNDEGVVAVSHRRRRRYSKTGRNDRVLIIERRRKRSSYFLRTTSLLSRERGIIIEALTRRISSRIEKYQIILERRFLRATLEYFIRTVVQSGFTTFLVFFFSHCGFIYIATTVAEKNTMLRPLALVVRIVLQRGLSNGP